MKDRTVLHTILIVLALFALWTLWGNVTIAVMRCDYTSYLLPEEFDGFTIVQVSDLHNAEFGAGNKRLLAKIKAAKPDMIAITGDLVDSEHTDLSVAVDFLEKASEIAPCYFVTGNHEARLETGYDELEKAMTELGVTVLHGESRLLERDGSYLQITGLDDPRFAEKYGTKTPEDSDAFRLLLAHRPELLAVYASDGYDLVLAGHMHGGQFRIPFIGGLIGSDSELFPKYDAGVFMEGDTMMFVSRGLGNSVIPIRINNRPELVVKTLYCDD